MYEEIVEIKTDVLIEDQPEVSININGYSYQIIITDGIRAPGTAQVSVQDIQLLTTKSLLYLKELCNHELEHRLLNRCDDDGIPFANEDCNA